MALYKSSVGFCGLDRVQNRPSTLLAVSTEPGFHLRSLPDFEGHSEASDVLRELFKTIWILVASQAKNQLYRKIVFVSTRKPPAPHLARTAILDPFAQRKN
jgi:hypothetical protein